MRDESLINIVSGADAAEEEDIFLRASLVAALCELYADKSAAAESDADDDATESQADPIDNDGAYDGTSTPIPFPHHRTARSRLRYGWAIAASLAAAVVFGGGVMWGG